MSKPTTLHRRIFGSVLASAPFYFVLTLLVFGLPLPVHAVKGTSLGKHHSHSAKFFQKGYDNFGLKVTPPITHSLNVEYLTTSVVMIVRVPMAVRFALWLKAFSCDNLRWSFLHIVSELRSRLLQSFLASKEHRNHVFSCGLPAPNLPFRSGSPPTGSVGSQRSRCLTAAPTGRVKPDLCLLDTCWYLSTGNQGRVFQPGAEFAPFLFSGKYLRLCFGRFCSCVSLL